MFEGDFADLCGGKFLLMLLLGGGVKRRVKRAQTRKQGPRLGCAEILLKFPFFHWLITNKRIMIPTTAPKIKEAPTNSK